MHGSIIDRRISLHLLGARMQNFDAMHLNGAVSCTKVLHIEFKYYEFNMAEILLKDWLRQSPKASALRYWILEENLPFFGGFYRICA